MKKTITFLMVVLMMLALAACGTQGSGTNTLTSDTTSTSAPTDSDAEQNDSTANPGDNSVPGNETSKILVAYFSCTNTTKPLAEYVADGLGADLYEITPTVPYTSDDLNYNDDNSRSSQEMNDPSSRPAISGSVENMEQYDIIFIAYPIWWGDAPRILSTFAESCDFSGKTVVPFCTSASSGIGSSAANLSKLTNGANWLPGKRFSGNTSRSDMISWVNSLGLDVTAK